MPEALLRDLRMDAGGEQLRCVRVAQAMEADLRQGRFGQGLRRVDAIIEATLAALDLLEETRAGIYDAMCLAIRRGSR